MNWRNQVEEFKGGMKVEGPSIRQGDLRIGFFGSIGSGKSVTSQICAIAITPAPGLIGVVDGEHGRSGLALDVACGLAAAKYGGDKAKWQERFRVVHVDPPFNPLRVIAAGEALMESGCKTLILDVVSQAWDSSGGYLDMANEEVERMIAANPRNTEERVRKAASAHIKPWTHQKMVHFVEEFHGNVILCFQAKQKWNAQTNQINEYETPIQESGITRTAIAVGKVESKIVDNKPVGGFCVFCGIPGATKHTHPDLLRLLPNDQQFEFEHGEKLVKWLTERAGGMRCSPTPVPAGQPDAQATVKALKSRLWRLTKPIHGGDIEKLVAWLKGTSPPILGGDESLDGQSEDGLIRICELAEIVLEERKEN